MTKISAIIPVYNTELYLGECIESILNQTLGDFELILVNDGSTDNSLNIVNSYARNDGRIKVVDLKTNVGVGEARNKGIDCAVGEFITFIDSDDLIKNYMFEKMYTHANKTNSDIVLCDTGTLSSDGRQKSVWYKYIDGKATLENVYRNTQPTARIVSKKLIDKLNFRFLSGMGEGIYFELMMGANHISTITEKMYIYRSREGSLSTTPNASNNYKSMLNNKILRDRNSEYKEYFSFKMIEDLLQMIASSVKSSDKLSYIKARNELKKLNYKKNKYLSTFYKKEYSIHKYLVKVHILPLNYQIAKIIHKITS